MKRLLLLFFISLITHSHAFATGGVTSNGGDSIAAEFTKIARQIAEVLKSRNDFPVSAQQLSSAIEQTWVVSKDQTILSGHEVDAINYPLERRIEVSRTRWLENNDSIRHRYVLVAHEYFGILGLDDSRYQLSEMLFDIPGVARHTLRCEAFSDGVLSFGPVGAQQDDRTPILELNLYDQQAIATVKAPNGEPIPLLQGSIGETTIFGSLDRASSDEKGFIAVVAVNLGFSIRMIQVPIASSMTGAFTAKWWDVRANAQVTPMTEVSCKYLSW